MNKKLKIIIIIIVSIILGLLLDILCIFIIQRPIFAVKNKEDSKYQGLLYDTYICEEYSLPQIKMKGTKFSCATIPNEIGEIVDIVDKTEICAQAIETFYIDEQNVYKFGCIKSQNIIVKYASGYQETLPEAFRNNRVTIKDLDKYNIGYSKEEREVS